jgi:predicted ferric reductase
MKNIKIWYWGLFITLTGLWLAADRGWMAKSDFFALRSSMVAYTGIIAIGMMSVSMVLAARPVMIESFLGGLDKMYRLHKWLGITGAAFAILHLLWAKSAGWLVGWGWLVRKGGRHFGGQGNGLAGFFQEQRGLAKSIGEWALYALIVLLVLALLRRFSYRRFYRSHRLLASVYLFLVFHSVVLMKFTDWGKPVGLVMLVLMTGGTVAAFISLFRRVGAGRRVSGEIEGITRHMDNRVLKVAVRLSEPWPGHLAGQFAFLTFDRNEGPHPFTISSTWKHDGRLGFLIKGIGDYTDTLAGRLKAGDSVTVEGPYGRFDFTGSEPRQIWIAGGIGIAPFIARMEALSEHPDGIPVDLFYSTSSPDEGFIAQVRLRAESAKVHLHVMVPARDGRLNAERIRSLIPEWKAAAFWFCGPSAFGWTLRRDLTSEGLVAGHFHQELFEMR